ncbi:MAG: polysaccharide biosynthesis/export family protein [Chthoniobacteraceae bacterium]
MKHLTVIVLSLLAIALPQVHADSKFRNGDVFEMRLSGPPEEFTREFNIVLTVDEGSVNVPLIGHIQAVGKSSTQLASEIENRLKQAKIFTIANVNITANTSVNQRFIIVGGSVRQPGRQPWVADLTLTGAISAAGGPNDFPGDGMKIIRGGVAERYSRKAIKKNPALDPKVQSGDIVELEGD